MTCYFTTLVKVRSGRVFDLGKREYPPFHKGDCQCASCDVVNAWTEEVWQEGAV